MSTVAPPAVAAISGTSALRLDLLGLPVLWAAEVLILWVRIEDVGPVNTVVLVASTMLLYMLLFWRRRRPLLTLVGLVLISGTLSVVVPGFHPIFCHWIALFAVAAHESRMRARLALFLSLVPVGSNVYETFRPPQGLSDGPVVVAAVVVFLLLITLATYGVGLWTRWSVAQRELVARLAAARAEAEERRRIARELHDVVAHSVSLMALQAAGAERVMDNDPVRARTALRQVGELGDQATEELRRMLGFLVPERGGEDAGTGAPARLRDVHRMLAQLRAAGRRIDLCVTGQTRPIDPTRDEAGYRILQEALTNALKYADPAQPVLVSVNWAPDELTLDVLSNGRSRAEPGAQPFSTGHGLRGMRDRARAAGGTVTTGPTPDGGFHVGARFPLPQVPAVADGHRAVPRAPYVLHHGRS